MELRDRFSDDEWLLLGSLPPMIGAVTAGVGKSGLGTIKEAFASIKAVMGGAGQYPDNALIGELMARASSWEEARERASGKHRQIKEKLEQRGIRTPEQFKEYLLEECRRTNQLLADRVSADEAAEYKEWVISIAEKVAAAAKEGGFLGFGGERISKEERELLQEIRETLLPGAGDIDI